MAATAARQSDTRHQQLQAFIEASLPPESNATVAVRLTPAIETACIIPCGSEAVEGITAPGPDRRQLANEMAALDADYLVIVSTQPAPATDLPTTSQLAADRYLQFGYALHELLHALKTDSTAIASLLEDRVDERHFDRVHELWNIAEDGAIENEAITGNTFGAAAADRLYILNVALSQTRDEIPAGGHITMTWWDAVTTALYAYCVYSPPRTQSLLYALLNPGDDAVRFESAADRTAFFEADPALLQLATDIHLLRSTPKDVVGATHDPAVSVTRAKRVLQTWEQTLRPLLENTEPDQPGQPDAEQRSDADAGGSDEHDAPQPSPAGDSQPDSNSGTADQTGNSENNSPQSPPPQSLNPSGQSTTDTPATDDGLETPSLTTDADSNPANSPDPEDLLETPGDSGREETDSPGTGSKEAEGAGAGAEDDQGADTDTESEDSTDTAPSDEKNTDHAGQAGSQSETNTDTQNSGSQAADADTDTGNDESHSSSPADTTGEPGESSEQRQGQVTLDSFAGRDEGSTPSSDSGNCDTDATDGETSPSDTQANSEDSPAEESQGSATSESADETECTESPPEHEDAGQNKPPAESQTSSPSDTSGESSPEPAPSPTPSPALNAHDEEAPPETEAGEETKARAEADTLDVDIDSVEDELATLAEQLDSESGDEPAPAVAADAGTGGDDQLDGLTVLPELDAESPAEDGDWNEIVTESKRVADRLEKALQLEQQSSARTGQTSGSYNATDGYKLSYGDPSVFERSTPGRKKRYSMVLIGDGSGSMRHGTPSKISIMRSALGQFAHAAEALGIDVAVIDFVEGEARLVKPFAVPVTAVRDAFTDETTGGGTPLSDALELGLALADSQRWQSLVITMTDGKPADVDECTSLINSAMTPVCSLTIATDCERGTPPKKAEQLDTAYDQSRVVYDGRDLNTELDRLASLLAAY